MAPAKDPAVAARMVPGTFMEVCAVSAPPNSKTTSDGMGGKIFSIKIKKKDAQIAEGIDGLKDKILHKSSWILLSKAVG